MSQCTCIDVTDYIEIIYLINIISITQKMSLRAVPFCRGLYGNTQIYVHVFTTKTLCEPFCPE